MFNARSWEVITTYNDGQETPESFIIPQALYRIGSQLLVPSESKVVYLNSEKGVKAIIEPEIRVEVVSLVYLTEKNRGEWNYVVGEINEDRFGRHYGDGHSHLSDQSVDETQFYQVAESALVTIPYWNLPIHHGNLYDGTHYFTYIEGAIGERHRYDEKSFRWFKVFDRKHIVDYTENKAEWWYLFQFWDNLKSDFEEQIYITRSNGIRT